MWTRRLRVRAGRGGLSTGPRDGRLGVRRDPVWTEADVWEHEVAEGTQPQLAAESVAYEIDVARWGSGPVDPVCALWDVTDDAAWLDVSAMRLSGAASVNGNVITTRRVSGLTAGRSYRLSVLFGMGGQTYMTFVRIVCRR